MSRFTSIRSPIRMAKSSTSARGQDHDSLPHLGSPEWKSRKKMRYHQKYPGGRRDGLKNILFETDDEGCRRRYRRSEHNNLRHADAQHCHAICHFPAVWVWGTLRRLKGFRRKWFSLLRVSGRGRIVRRKQARFIGQDGDRRPPLWRLTSGTGRPVVNRTPDGQGACCRSQRIHISMLCSRFLLSDGCNHKKAIAMGQIG